MQNIVKDIKEKACDLGFFQVGICNAEPLNDEQKLLEEWLGFGYHGKMDWMQGTLQERSNPKSFFPEAKSIIVLAHNYYRSNELISRSPQEGNISIYARGRDYHKVIRKKLIQLVEFIQQLLPDVKSRICVDSFPIMEKPLAVKAGIGWIGKHTNLIIKGKGSYFFLGEILLSEELPADEVWTTDYCGTCNKCQVACPTDALDNAYVLDSNKCISYLTIEHDSDIKQDLQNKMGNWIFGCDICQEVCPWNSFSEDTNETDFSSRFSEDFFDLNNLNKLSENDFSKVFNGTPIKRTGHKNFIRNVEIALRNKEKD
jgi:epoxyqueuosine reductase